MTTENKLSEPSEDVRKLAEHIVRYFTWPMSDYYNDKERANYKAGLEDAIATALQSEREKSLRLAEEVLLLKVRLNEAAKLIERLKYRDNSIHDCRLADEWLAKHKPPV